MMDLRTLARLLDGEVVGEQVLAPGPGHGPRDRSLSVRLSTSSPDGFLTHSFAGDDFRGCRDYITRRLGLDRWKAPRRSSKACGWALAPRQEEDNREKKISDALALWAAGVDPRGTIAERYLASRRLSVEENVARHVLRWHPGVGAMTALFRNIVTDAPQGISRTFFDRKARKIERKFLGPVGCAAVKLDADETVLGGLHVGEGVETCLAARQFGLRPTWALGSKGAIGAFPVLPGIECLTILAESDAEREIAVCAARWHAAGREVFINRSTIGKDLNDAIRVAP
jgi:hypothetical protein